jgi:hypothetical protein
MDFRRLSAGGDELGTALPCVVCEPGEAQKQSANVIAPATLCCLILEHLSDVLRGKVANNKRLGRVALTGRLKRRGERNGRCVEQAHVS